MPSPPAQRRIRARGKLEPSRIFTSYWDHKASKTCRSENLRGSHSFGSLGHCQKTARPVRSWYYHAHTTPPVLNECQWRLLSEGFPRNSIRLGYGSLTVDLEQRQKVFSLPSHQWPSSNGKPLWPSCPSLPEWLTMVRTGYKPDPVRELAPSASSLTEFRSNPVLAKEIVRRNVIGVRSDIEVPTRYLGNFRYKWGFLILTCPTCPPIGLARFLARLWQTNPQSLWLRINATLKSYLREVPIGVLRPARDKWAKLNEFDSSSSLSGSSQEPSEYDSDDELTGRLLTFSSRHQLA